MNQSLQIIRIWGLGSACAGLGLALALQPALAVYFDRMPASVCRPAVPKNFAHHYVIATTATMLESISNSATDYICKIPDKSNLPASSITSIKVAVRDSHSTVNITIKACAFNAANGQGFCGTPKTTSGTGYSEQELTTSGGYLAELQALRTPYLWINLPGSQAGAASAIAGLYFYSSTI